MLHKKRELETVIDVVLIGLSYYQPPFSHFLKTSQSCERLLELVDGVDSAQKEIALWFKPSELADYEKSVKGWIYESAV